MSRDNYLIEYTKWLSKWLLAAVLGLAIIAAIIIFSPSITHWFTHTRHADNVVVRLITDSAGCADDGYQYGIVIQNKSEKTVEFIEVRVKITKIGFSTDIVVSTDKYLRFDNIIEPEKSVGYCYNLRVKTDLSYKNDNANTSDHNVDLELYRVRFSD